MDGTSPLLVMPFKLSFWNFCCISRIGLKFTWTQFHLGHPLGIEKMNNTADHGDDSEKMGLFPILS